MLTARGFKLVKFADPLKDMLRVLGLGQEELEGARKGLPCKLLHGRSPRYAMQTLGTEWGRGLIHDELWSSAWKARARQLLLDGSPVVCDDCRFENEVRAIQDLGGELWSIRRQGIKMPVVGHVSESGIAYRYATRRLDNRGTIQDLHLAVALALGESNDNR